MCRLIVAALSASVLASVACSDAPGRAPADVAGWYVREIGGGREVVDVRPSGDYVHVVTRRGTAARADEAHWHASGDSSVTLDAFRGAAAVGNGTPRGGSVRVSIHAAAPGDLRLQLPGDSATFVRRLRYGKQRGG